MNYLVALESCQDQQRIMRRHSNPTRWWIVRGLMISPTVIGQPVTYERTRVGDSIFHPDEKGNAIQEYWFPSTEDQLATDWEVCEMTPVPTT